MKMSNAFENAKKKMEDTSNEDVEVQNKRPEDYEAPEEVNQDAEHSNKKKTIDEDNITDTQWIKNPKEEGDETGDLTFREFFMQDGRWIKIKEGPKKGEEFWSGLTVKNKQSKQIDYVEEYIIEAEEGSINLKSWEQVSKMKAFIRYCKINKHKSTGQTINFVRMGKGSDTAGNNWLLKIPSLGIKITEESQIEKLED